MFQELFFKPGEARRGVEDLLVFETCGGDYAEAFRGGDVRWAVQWILVRLPLNERGFLFFGCPFTVVVHFVCSTGFSRNGVGLKFRLSFAYCDG